MLQDEKGPFEVRRKELSKPTGHTCSTDLDGEIPPPSKSSANGCLSQEIISEAIAGEDVPISDKTASPCSCSSRNVVPLFGQARRLTPLRNLPETENLGEDPPERHYECNNYDTCLSLAAALDWNSFSCCGCSGCINQKLVWRANHVLRRSQTLRQICNLPLHR